LEVGWAEDKNQEFISICRPENWIRSPIYSIYGRLQSQSSHYTHKQDPTNKNLSTQRLSVSSIKTEFDILVW